MGRTLDPYHLQVFHLYDFVSSLEILTPPESQQVVINSGWVTFYCQTRGDKAQWNVNGEYYDAYNHTEDGIEFGQFVTYHRFDDTRNTQDNYMGLPSGLEWNMTEIHCASRIDQRVTSDNVYLIIMGKLLSIATNCCKFQMADLKALHVLC